jgi:hypothetical protein
VGTSFKIKVEYGGFLNTTIAKSGTSKIHNFRFKHIYKSEYDKDLGFPVFEHERNKDVLDTFRKLGKGSIIELDVNLKGFEYGANKENTGTNLEIWRVTVIQAANSTYTPPAPPPVPPPTPPVPQPAPVQPINNTDDLPF